MFASALVVMSSLDVTQPGYRADDAWSGEEGLRKTCVRGVSALGDVVWWPRGDSAGVPVSGICRFTAFVRPGYRTDVTLCLFLLARCHIGTIGMLT
jgi:hypothetical protein